MSNDPIIASICMFGGNFAPRGWADCAGQLLPISQNSALFSILGTIYGGDGRTTLGLPDLRGRVPVGIGNGPGLTSINIGQKAGINTIKLEPGNLPSHTHTITGSPLVRVADQKGTVDAAKNNALGKAALDIHDANKTIEVYVENPEYTKNFELAGVEKGTLAAANTGSNLPFDNMQPFLGVRYVIALVGTYPSRS